MEVTRGTEIELFSVGGTDGFLREVNEAFARLLGRTVDELRGRSVLELVHPGDLTPVVAALGELDGGAPETVIECRFAQADGRAVHLQWVARSVAGGDAWWASGRDTTEFHRLVAKETDLRARLDLALGQATTAMWELDVASGALTWERQAAQVLGVDAASTPSGTDELAALVHPDDAAALLLALDGLTEAGEAEVAVRVGSDLAARHLSVRGKVIDRDWRGRALRAVGLVLDVTTEKAMEEQMLRMAMSDALTGVPNRRAFDKALRGEWRRCARAGQPMSVLMIDIDDFKRFNDLHGHLVGDEALSIVARALGAAIHREGDVLARFGGEEFAVVLPGTDSAGALTVAHRMVEVVAGTSLAQAPDWPLGVSVGAASCLPEGSPRAARDLVHRADEAVYAAKAAGKGRAVSYEDFLAGRDELRTAIARGLADGELRLWYQPLIDIAGRRLVGFEALMRWERPGHGLVPPGVFIPVAEGTDLICDLGRWALREAAEQLATWTREGVDPGAELKVAVNASGRHVGSPAIVEDVADAIAAAGIAPCRLELEMTETTLVADDRAAEQLARVRELGVCVAIDDFGTGHTSLSQLAHLPADTMKIDRSFVSSDDPARRSLVRLLIEAARAFGLRTVGEGIEEPATLEWLRGLGCDVAQGYLLGRPMPAGEVPAWIERWRADAGDAVVALAA